MQKLLNEVEVRVLGSLIEKQVTTPEYYPLTLNALTLACNQKNNRNPVVSFDEAEVAKAIDSLRKKNLVYLFYGSNNRTPKYKNMMTKVFHLNSKELAVMCILMLRGPQTVGEIRGRADRLYVFTGLEEIEETLNSLLAKDLQALVAKLPRQPGQKEVRYTHLLAGEVSTDNQAEIEDKEIGVAHSQIRADRYSSLENQVEALRAQVESFRQDFEEFRKQFD